MKLNLLYFAWLRERIGCGQEIIETDAETVTDLIADLILRDPCYAAAFEDISSVRVAVEKPCRFLNLFSICTRSRVFSTNDWWLK
jgi:molybdopterin synthase sulfur carrier subunit